jgi:RimJ/RimL family protein N-acetyltransferase
MITPGTRLVRPSRSATWRVVRGSHVEATAEAMLRPDRRWFVSVDTWDECYVDELVEAMVDDLRQDLYTMVEESDTALTGRWLSRGFAVERREHEVLIPTDPGVTGLPAGTVPPGIALIAADAVDEDRLRLLDEELRNDVPGSDRWVNDPQEFREYTFAERSYDPSTYLVAVDDANEAFTGLVRVWNYPGRRPRLGLIGVTRPYRRRGLARTLLGAAFAALHEQQVEEVSAEVDATNDASTALLASAGAHRIGTSVQLVRRWPGISVEGSHSAPE